LRSEHDTLRQQDRGERARRELMANLVWTGILYFATLMIVYVTYRAFAADKRAEALRRTSELVSRAYAGAGRAAPVASFDEPKPAPVDARPVWQRGKQAPAIRRPAVAVRPAAHRSR
jgi:hypothetical protein